MSSDAEIAWAAGLFEGEGCFYGNFDIDGRRVSASLTSTDKDVLESFCGVVGAGRVLGPYTNGNKPTHSPTWQWSLTKHNDIKRVMQLFWPWLHARRRAKITELLTKFDNYQRPPHMLPKRARFDKEAEVVGMKKTGASASDVAKHFGISRIRVHAILRRYTQDGYTIRT